MQHSMWRFLGDAMMHRLQDSQDHKYAEIVKAAEKSLLEGSISGHQAAQQILKSIFNTH